MSETVNHCALQESWMTSWREREKKIVYIKINHTCHTMMSTQHTSNWGAFNASHASQLRSCNYFVGPWPHSSLVYRMIDHTPLVASNLPIKTSVARRWSTNNYTLKMYHHADTHIIPDMSMHGKLTHTRLVHTLHRCMHAHIHAPGWYDEK